MTNIELYNSLIEKALIASRAYYDNDNPIMSDYEYDEIIRSVKRIEKAYPELIREDSPTQKVGGTPSKSSFAKVKHEVPMLSLEDKFTKDEVASFLSQFTDHELFSVEEKIDGLSMSVTYKNGKLVRAETRGDGLIGEDITENAKHIIGIPVTINPQYSQYTELEVRCEVYLPINEFERINKELENQDKKLFVNPRNAAAGILRTKDIGTVIAAHLHAFAFNIQRANVPIETHEYALYELDNMWFATVPRHFVYSKNVYREIDEIQKRKNNLNYWIDGAVIKIDSIKRREELGETNKNPRWAIAYKYPPEEKQTIIKDIILQAGRTGRITPVAILDPVFLAGTKVERATLHNPEIIKKLNVKIGDTVIVRKAAEIIPEIVSVSKSSLNNKYNIFEHKCPSCNGNIVPRVGDDKNISGAYCNNPNCPAQIARKFEFWCSRDCMDIRGMGSAIIDNFIELKWLKTIPDIYKLYEHKDEMIKLEGFGKKAVENLLTSIDKSKSRDIDRLIKSLGIEGIGKSIGKELAKIYPNMNSIINISKDKDKMSEIDGIGDISSQALYDYFNNEDNCNMLNELFELGINSKSLEYNKQENNDSTSKKLTGLIFVITGTLPTMKRDEASKLIETHGGKVAGSVSKKTNYLLCGEAAGSKLDKAKALGIKIISEYELESMIK